MPEIGPTVRLRGEQIVGATAEECAARLVEALAEHLHERLRRFARVHLALSGGSSGELLCRTLARGNQARAWEWESIHVWQVDERCVADDDAHRNFGMIRDVLGPVTKNLHPMPVLQADGAGHYERELRTALAEREDAAEQCLDAVVLGMGADGHTASLFPGTVAIEERERWIVWNDGEQVAPPRPRMTMTYPLLNRARFIALLVTGAGKQAGLRRLAGRHEGMRTLPVAGVVPEAGAHLAWFLDRAAMP